MFEREACAEWNARPVRGKLWQQTEVLRLLERRWDAGHHASGCGAAHLSALDGRCVRAAASERSNTAVIQTRQVSSL